jgi:transposase-like protein
MAIKHISKDEAITETHRLVARGLSIDECARELGLKRATLYGWLREAGLRYEVRCAILVPVEEDQ